MHNTSVTVIIPTYNRQKYLGSAIRSAQNQTYSDIEILVCDDGSTDKTRELVIQMSKVDSRIRLIRLEHCGIPGRVRNAGINESHGEYIAFLDSDDTWFPNKLECMIEYIEANKLDMACSNAYRIMGKKESLFFLKSFKENLTFYDLLNENKVICSSALVKKRVIDNVGGFPELDSLIAIEDWATWLKIALLGRIGYINSALLKYNDDPDNSIRSNLTSYKVQKQAVISYLLRWLIKDQGLSTTTFSATLQLIKLKALAQIIS